MKVIIASNNAHKIKEIKDIVGDYFDGVLSLGDSGIDIEIEENGASFRENAYIKAHTVQALTGMAALADDSGLCVDALGGAPGIYSARYSQKGDAGNNALLLRNLEGVPFEKRTARFQCCIALCLPDGTVKYADGAVEGFITDEARGDNGFGYDPLFQLADSPYTMAQLSPEEKNKCSHRSLALKHLREILEKI